jgi:hypothetical protein
VLNHQSTWAISATANSGRNFRRLLIGDFTGSSWSIPCWDDHQHGLPCRSTAENAWFFFGFCLHIYPTLNKNAGAQPQFQLPTGLCLSHLLRGLLWSIGPISQRIWSDLPENSPWNTKKRQFNSHWSSIVNISTNQKKHVEKKVAKINLKVAQKLKKVTKRWKRTTHGYTINSSKKNTVAVSTWFGCCALAIIPADLDKAAWGDRVVIGGPGNPGAPMGPPARSSWDSPPLAQDHPLKCLITTFSSSIYRWVPIHFQIEDATWCNTITRGTVRSPVTILGEGSSK